MVESLPPDLSWAIYTLLWWFLNIFVVKLTKAIIMIAFAPSINGFNKGILLRIS